MKPIQKQQRTYKRYASNSNIRPYGNQQYSTLSKSYLITPKRGVSPNQTNHRYQIENEPTVKANYKTTQQQQQQENISPVRRQRSRFDPQKGLALRQSEPSLKVLPGYSTQFRQINDIHKPLWDSTFIYQFLKFSISKNETDENSMYNKYFHYKYKQRMKIDIKIWDKKFNRIIFMNQTSDFYPTFFNYDENDIFLETNFKQKLNMDEICLKPYKDTIEYQDHVEDHYFFVFSIQIKPQGVAYFEDYLVSMKKIFYKDKMRKVKLDKGIFCLPFFDKKNQKYTLEELYNDCKQYLHQHENDLKQKGIPFMLFDLHSQTDEIDPEKQLTIDQMLHFVKPKLKRKNIFEGAEERVNPVFQQEYKLLPKQRKKDLKRPFIFEPLRQEEDIWSDERQIQMQLDKEERERELELEKLKYINHSIANKSIQQQKQKEYLGYIRKQQQNVKFITKAEAKRRLQQQLLEEQERIKRMEENKRVQELKEVDKERILIRLNVLDNYDETKGPLAIDMAILGPKGPVLNSKGKPLEYILEDIEDDDVGDNCCHIDLDYIIDEKIDFLKERDPEFYKYYTVVILFSIEPEEEGAEDIQYGWFGYPLFDKNGEVNQVHVIDHIYSHSQDVQPVIPIKPKRYERFINDSIIDMEICHPGQPKLEKVVLTSEKHIPKKNIPKQTIANKKQYTEFKRGKGGVRLKIKKLVGFDESKYGLGFDLCLVGKKGIIRDRHRKPVEYQNDEIFDGDQSDNVVDIDFDYELKLNHEDLKHLNPQNYHDYRFLFHFAQEPNSDNEDNEEYETDFGWYSHFLFDPVTNKPNLGEFKVKVFAPPLRTGLPLKEDTIKKLDSEFIFELQYDHTIF